MLNLDYFFFTGFVLKLKATDILKNIQHFFGEKNGQGPRAYYLVL